MRLSYVIPTRNQAQYLRQCIDSCLAQGVADAEVLVLDGASTDGTQDVLRSYGDRVRWRSERDRGQSDAVNQGVAMAQGELIAWINSDDYYASEHAIATALAVFDADPRVDIVYGDGLRVANDGHTIGPYHAAAYEGAGALIASPLKFVLQPCLLFRRSLYLAVGGLDESLHYTMDYDLWLRLFPAARVARQLPDVIACARYHADAKSVAAMGRQIAEAFRVKQRAATQHHLSLVTRAKLYASMAELWAYWLAVRTGIKRAS